MTIKTAVITHSEAIRRRKAADNSKLGFLNGTIKEGSPSAPWYPHNTGCYAHVRMLAGDYPCFANIGSHLHGDNYCKLCQALRPQTPAPVEGMVHLVTMCRATAETRTRILPDLLNLVSQYYPYNQILLEPNPTQLTQFILDPTSLNLPVGIRICSNSKDLHKVITVCRNICFSIHKDRTKQLRILK